MKKLLMFLLIGMFMIMISTVSAAEWDNSLRYEKEDMKVTIENAFGLPFFGGDLGTAELKSHKSVNHILKVAPGKDVVTMYYDINFNKIYKDGLGEVEFIDVRSGEIINKDYHFVIWGTIIEEKNNYSIVCEEVYIASNNSYSQGNCESVIIGTYLEEKEGWVKLNTNDIPKGEVRIGLATDVNLGDAIDGVWTIAGKKIKKHAVWTASLNVGLVSYYKFEGDVTDSLGVNNLTDVGSSSADGIINLSRTYASGDYLIKSSFNGEVLGANPRTLCGWGYPAVNDDYQHLYSKQFGYFFS